MGVETEVWTDVKGGKLKQQEYDFEGVPVNQSKRKTNSKSGCNRFMRLEGFNIHLWTIFLLTFKKRLRKKYF
jgi:hypothetical protein